MKDAKQFWDLYFTNALLSFARDGKHYAFEAYPPHTRNSAAAWLKGGEEPERFKVPIDEIRAYDYLSDQRFVSLVRRPKSLSQTLESIWSDQYPYRDAAPLSRAQMRECVKTIRRAFGDQIDISDEAGNFKKLCQQTQELLQNIDEPTSMHLQGLIWILGESRSPLVTETLVDIVRRAPFAPFVEHTLPGTLSDLSLSALSKVNDKSCVPSLLALFDCCELEGKKKVAPLFERMLSTKVLNSQRYLGDSYFETSFWEELLRQSQTSCQNQWNVFSCREIFWEHRLLGLVRSEGKTPEIIEIASQDEVSVISKYAEFLATQRST